VLGVGELVDLLAGNADLLHDLELVLQASVLGGDLALLGDDLRGINTLGLLQIQVCDFRGGLLFF
jgi:hypothetical protein